MRSALRWPPPDRRDATEYECPETAQTVRMVRHIASTGKVRVLTTNFRHPAALPAHELGDLYHQRLLIEEAFKCLKHRLKSRARLRYLAAGQDARSSNAC